MEKSKYKAIKSPGAAGAYIGLQQHCIRTGDGAYLHASQWSDLEADNVTIYAVDPVGTGTMRAGAHTKRLDESTAELRGFVVHPFARKGGRGEQLGRFIIDEEFASGVDRIVLGVRILNGQLNEPAVRLYLRLGFQTTGEVLSVRPTPGDPRSSHLIGTLDADGNYQMSIFELLKPVREVRRYG